MYKELKVGVFLAFHDSRFISAYILLKLPRRIDHIAAAWSRADSTREIVVGNINPYDNINNWK